MNMLKVIAVASIICAPGVYAGDKIDADHCTAKINQLDSIERSEGLDFTVGWPRTFAN